MDPFYQMDKQTPGDASAVTADFFNGQLESRATSPRCNLALPGVAGSGQTQEIGPVLRRRLLIASLIPAASCTIFFIRSLIDPPTFLGYGDWLTVLLGAGAAIFVLISTVLASHLSFNVRQLRGIELVLFGSLAVYFAIVQIMLTRHGAVLEWAKAGQESHILRLANWSNILRWFVLIVIYGTFVPNTWKRCALFTALWVAIPVALTFVVCVKCPVMGPHTFQSLLDTIIILGIASAIAIFGSYKISELQHEATQAKKLGQYQLKEKLGRGGMGEVYLGEHTMLRRACAIKLIRPDQTGDCTAIKRFEREVKAMAQLTHWNTVEVFDYGSTDDGTFYYVMEYLPGKSLQEIVDQHGPLPPGRAVHFLRQICEALREAHSMDLIHRDIKPSNVLATKRGGVYDVAKLLDFGLVQSVSLHNEDPRLTMQGAILGSPLFMSPEQALGKTDLDGQTDIYSLGALAYFLLTGQAPFVRDTPMQILMAHVHERVVPLTEHRPELPQDLQDIILRCLDKDPAERFADAESLEQALAACECADDWSRHEAAAWWDDHIGQRRLAKV